MKIIQLTRGWVAWVDDDDFEQLDQFLWYAAKGKAGRFYAHRIASRKSCQMHAYDKASLRLHGEFGRRNILKEIPVCPTPSIAVAS